MFMEEKLSLGIYFITLFTLYAKVVALQHRSSDRLICNSANNFHPLCQSSMVQPFHFSILTKMSSIHWLNEGLKSVASLLYINTFYIAHCTSVSKKPCWV